MDIKMHIRVAKCKKIRRGFGFILFLTKKIDSQVKLRSIFNGSKRKKNYIYVTITCREFIFSSDICVIWPMVLTQHVFFSTRTSNK
jgi:hypothetical protein